MIWASPRFGHPQWGMPKTLIASTLPNLACSKRSDGGERCEVKKAMKSRGGLGREVRSEEWGVRSLTSPPPSLLFFALLFTSHRSPLSERLEQAMPKLSQTGKSRDCQFRIYGWIYCRCMLELYRLTMFRRVYCAETEIYNSIIWLISFRGTTLHCLQSFNFI